MANSALRKLLHLSFVVSLTTVASAQSFRVQCPSTTLTHPTASDSEPPYLGPGVNGAIKCQQISGGDGYATMGDGTQTYMFSFGPLSGIADITSGNAGTEFPSVFNTPYAPVGPPQPGFPNCDPTSGSYPACQA